MAKPAQTSVFVPYPPGFRPRRGLNWAFIGLLYTSFYMCRYNLPLASGEIRNELGFSKAQIGSIITTALLAYACGQIVNGLLADRFGGKRAMLIGAAGTIVMNTSSGWLRSLVCSRFSSLFVESTAIFKLSAHQEW